VIKTGVFKRAGEIVAWLPRGRALPCDAWKRRHRGLGLLLWAHVAAGLTRQMLAYSGSSRLEVEPVDLTPLVEEIATLAAAGISKRVQLVLELERESPVVVRGDAGQLSQVVLNLITNAAESLPDGVGTVTVRTGRELTGADPRVFVDVSDSGCGMTAETKARMFEPFFTTKFTGRGLGLAAVDGIVRSHGGRIEVESVVDRGTSCRVALPAIASPALAPPVLRAHSPSPASPGVTILLVDDEPSVLEVGRHILERNGFEVIPAASGSEAAQLFAAHDAPVAAAIVDMSMPGLNGLETMRALRSVDPPLPVILTSGYTTETLEAGLQDGTRFIQKPYSRDGLLELLREVIRERATAAAAA
jgi:two-component system cell cycle sensor histidine kinase/response regulator CckA